MKIAVFGGTFDPVHNGHLNIARNVIENLKINKVLFVPTGNPPHKDNSKLSDKFLRYKMVEQAIKGYRGFEISDIETKNENLSYTAETILKLKDIYKNDQLYFLCGSDVLYYIETWKTPDVIFRNIPLIVCYREYDKNLEKQAEYLKEKYGGEIILCNIDIYEISSTEIRKEIKRGNCPKEFLPEKVIEIIKNNNLYT